MVNENNLNMFLDCLVSMGFRYVTWYEGIKYSLGKYEYTRSEDGLQVYIGSGEGYGSFYGQFSFDRDGRFITHGLWE